jgi:F-type H+-transporting ATPase subunit epsilon
MRVSPSLMQLKILLPFQVFAEEAGVSRIVAETPTHGEVCLAVDEGVLVKAGAEVLVSVRRAFWGTGDAASGGKDLGQLRHAVTQAFLTQDAQAQTLRIAMAKVESGFLRRFARLEKT